MKAINVYKNNHSFLSFPALVLFFRVESFSGLLFRLFFSSMEYWRMMKRLVSTTIVTTIKMRARIMEEAKGQPRKYSPT